ncbi:MAG: carbon-phosphorus lyase complex subunit PhnI [Chloroflexi bacterium]|uniref:Carbon-phosphorus lyase complex subunit PhnI n=1 Tax=Candidatus Chlorohelix allophototropha TaxID=3003348 RepID=A0A8T7M534_9CHLR|nr:carbon-phosphorus lyase complex subunit PhnI [Chloroflexota bacterium]WJW69126.1 carbon-phosphorus lyase complex subunit PhnI [Chloroflexota bacterium L227-S17]
MGYVAVKGGIDAILAAEELVKLGRLQCHSELLQIDQLIEQQRMAVDQVMSEAGLYDEKLAALALKQAEGDLMEAGFLLRAYKSTLERLGYSLPIDTSRMKVLRRISSAFKNIPGGQVLGRTRDYTQRLLDFNLIEEIRAPESAFQQPKATTDMPKFSRVSDLLRAEGLLTALAPSEQEPFDITRDTLKFPAPRSARLQTLARGETGAMVALGYSSLRGYGMVHPTISELRYGKVPVEFLHPLTGNPVTIGQLRVTEVEALNHDYSIVGRDKDGIAQQESTNNNEEKAEPLYELGYGLVYGQNERKAISMSILDRAMDIGGDAPSSDQEFVLYHIDSVESSGFVEHLKLPHYVTFQSSLDRSREETRLAYAAEARKK